MKLSLIIFVACIASTAYALPVAENEGYQPSVFGDDIIQEESKAVAQVGTAKNRWPSGVLPYTLDSTYNRSEKNTIVAAMRDLENKVKIGGRMCIKLVPRTNQAAWVHVEKKEACQAAVGKTKENGSQPIILGPRCIPIRSTIQHEIMHALGFRHEQQRPDRDNYITIKWENMKPGDGGWLNKLTNFDYQGLPYDIKSIMHYGPGAGSKNGKPTMVANQGTLKDNTEMTALDIAAIRKYYNCK